MPSYVGNFRRYPLKSSNFKVRKKNNPFKVNLISKVQLYFDKKVEEEAVPEFQNEDDKEEWFK